MTQVLGLPVSLAVKLLEGTGKKDLQIERYIAPRGEHTRGTLRVVRYDEKSEKLTVCLFPDEVQEDMNTDES